jgi:hypothetical protein
MVAPLVDAIETHAPQGPLAVLSMRTIIYPAFPAINYSGSAWGLRHNALWFLSGLYGDQDASGAGPLRANAPEAMSPLERTFFDQIVDDLCAAPPRLLAIERAVASAPAGRRALDLQEYYAQSPGAKRLFEGYRAQDSLGPFTLLVPASIPSCH